MIIKAPMMTLLLGQESAQENSLYRNIQDNQNFESTFYAKYF